MQEELSTTNIPAPVKLKKSFRHSYFSTSPKATEILKTISLYEGKMTLKEIYGKLKKLDDNVPDYDAFISWHRFINRKRNEQAMVMLGDLQNVMLREDTANEKVLDNMLNIIYQKLFTAGNAVVNEEIRETVELLKEGKNIPADKKKRLMDWFFRSSANWQNQKAIDFRIETDRRTETIIDNLLAAAQYQKLRKPDIVDGEFEEVKKVISAKEEKMK